MNITIPNGIRHCCAREGSRYAIQAVEARPGNEPGEAYLSATDGRVLAVVPTSADDLEKPILIPYDVLPTRKDNDVILKENGFFRQVRGGKIVDEGDPDGSFPPTADVVPKGDTFKLVIGLNAGLLLNLAHAVGEEGTVTLLIGKPNKPIGVMGPEGFGVLMPANIEHRELEQAQVRWDRDADAYRDACKPKPEPSPTDRKIMGDDAAERHAAIAP